MKSYILIVIIAAQVVAVPQKYKMETDMTKIKDISGDNKMVQTGMEFTTMRDMTVLQPETIYEELAFSAFAGDPCPAGKAKIYGEVNRLYLKIYFSKGLFRKYNDIYNIEMLFYNYILTSSPINNMFRYTQDKLHILHKSLQDRDIQPFEMKAFVLLIVAVQVLALPSNNTNETKDTEKGLEGLKLLPEVKGNKQNKTFEVVPFAAFAGDACPTGKAKVHGVCVDID